MDLVAIAWLYVALMMAVAEATHPAGTLLGAIVTFLFYGLLPTALVMYIMGTPLRRKARLAQEAQALKPAPTPPADTEAAPLDHSDTGSPLPVQPDASGHATGAAQARSVPPV
ncbi:MAG: hypothetical protein C0445_02825 [Polaromonas sp.]|nr:hypothetical protein [Polaromonas sp.]